MQFCPRCGSSNQDGRAACWKCFGQLQKPDSKKAQHITLTDKDTPAAQPAIDAPAVLPIPELAEAEPDVPTPAFTLDSPFVEASPEVVAPVVEAAESAPQVASFGDVMIPSPSFDSGDQTISEDEDEEDVPSQPVPILGLVNLPEDEQEEPATLDLDGPATVPVFGIEGLSDEPLVAGSSAGTQSADGTGEPGLPWWLTQDDSEDASAGVNGSTTIDLDDNGGLEFISLDDDDADSKKSPPDA